jgi:hypothetical protein
MADFGERVANGNPADFRIFAALLNVVDTAGLR